MYLRHKTVRSKDGSARYWTLVRSVRHGSRVVQETVAHLGRLDEHALREATALARHFLGPRAHQPDLFEDTRELSSALIKLGKVRVERSRAFGAVFLGWTLWKALELDKFCERTLPHGREEVPWAQVAAILVIARLCEPSSELHIAEDWYRRTALDDILGVAPEPINHTRLYQGLDRLLEHKRELEVHIKDRLGGLFALDYDLLLYDVTSTYFEGEALGNPMAKRGYSRDSRPDCKQVCIGLVVTREGYPLGYELFDGNRVDVTTVEEIVEEMERRYGKAGRVWVMDRGMVSEENLEWLRAGGRRYLLGTPKSEMKKWEQKLVEREGWKSIRDGLEVKLCEGPEGAETFILCRSADRAHKERAMHERFEKRIRVGLERLARRLASQTRVDRSQVERQIGRLLGRNSRAAGLFDVRVVEEQAHKSGVRLEVREQTQWSEWASLTEGTYILRSNVNEWSAEELWQTYIQLTQAEAAFRIHKSELRMRPIWHQKEERVQAHILVCFLAFCLWKTLQGWQTRAGLGHSPRTLLDEIARIQTVDVVLPQVDGPELRLRCVSRPDKAQADLLQRLGIDVPRRLRAPPQLATV
jgi:transposase